MLVNSTTQQREQQRYQLLCFGNRSGNIWRLYFLDLPHPFCQWLAALAFVYSLATIEWAYKMFRRSLNGHISCSAPFYGHQKTFRH